MSIADQNAHIILRSISPSILTLTIGEHGVEMTLCTQPVYDQLPWRGTSDKCLHAGLRTYDSTVDIGFVWMHTTLRSMYDE